MYNDDQTVVREREVTTDPPRRTVVDRPAYVATGPGPVDYARRVVAVIFLIVQLLLVLRIVFLLLIANRDNGIVQAVLSWSDPLVQPFIGMFRFNDVRSSSGSVLDTAAVVALVAWTIIEWIILAVLGIFRGREAPAAG